MKKTELTLIIILTTMIGASLLFMEPVSSSLVSHDPIYINTDDGFETLGFEGSGTKNNPYIIENLLIQLTDDANVTAIRIHYTTKHFVIRNYQVICGINNSETYGDFGIYISLVAEGTAVIENNRIDGFVEGIHVISSNATIVKENQIYNCTDGIFVSQSGSTRIISNTISKVERYNLEVRYSNDVEVTNNTLGLPFTNSYGATRLAYSSECAITYNTFEEALLLDASSEDNVIHHNNFKNAARDDGKYNEWYDSVKEEGNWWKDYSGHGVVDIAGSAEAQDLYPLKDQATYISSASLSWIFLVCIPIVVILKNRRKPNK